MDGFAIIPFGPRQERILSMPRRELAVPQGLPAQQPLEAARFGAPRVFEYYFEYSCQPRPGAEPDNGKWTPARVQRRPLSGKAFLIYVFIFYAVR